MSLETLIKKQIERDGPMGIDTFMELALSHPEHGYYMKKDPFGAQGDFTTAPEISQMFGEILGAWLADTWIKMGSPAPFLLLECGPGRGTLMADILRATQGVEGFHDAAKITLLEISPVLKGIQQQTLSQYNIEWIESLEDLPQIPTLFIANELLDALPIKQFIEGKERTIILKGNDLKFSAEGDITEKSPARLQFFQTLETHIITNTGTGLFIDYGFKKGQGDTLQALYKHKFCSPLEYIGDADITSHVDFGALIGVAQCPTYFEEQSAFLKKLGITHRAEYLASKTDPEKIYQDLHRLTSPDEMGTLFKVLGISHDQSLDLAGF